MQTPHVRSPDPLVAMLALSAAFLALCLWRITIPTAPFFDEIHYLPAARAMLDGSQWMNAEHPPLGKFLIAGALALFGDSPLGWRIVPALSGAISLFALGRALWFASASRFATLAYLILLATGFFLFVHARIAMLDGIMVAFVSIALWQFARAIRAPEEGRWRLALTGLAIGAAMATKWNALPLAIVPGLAFFFVRLSAGRRRLLVSRRGAPVPGISLLEAGLWLGLVPLAIYALSFAPLFWMGEHPFGDRGLFGIQAMMLELQQSVKATHNYQSRWDEWLINWRAIWYLYEPVDGAQRGVLLIGNPLTMLLGLPAMLWCGWIAATRQRKDALAIVILFAVSLGFWIVASKPTQFYYHYFLPSCFLLAALALALAALRNAGWTKLAWVTLIASTAVFAWFYPILSAAPLDGPESFATWMWLDSWR
ncbi:glycosyltransferase family 39 protein [Parerythrobacter jejuensis]|uniref:Polyprenol-phosphate-mannose--protein mannosyltransferase n=2 Tax=Parerythrobacter jejuensis TaxID=795812 RepID=A0A845AUC1_9SPHN|nr:glycosyltransferase family 39 protein [Parerythrobacter jejuensis]MXP32773.1 phospholipid carrier-dependent glycosyltransferase [Parerythrobacter jejuensis]